MGKLEIQVIRLKDARGVNPVIAHQPSKGVILEVVKSPAPGVLKRSPGGLVELYPMENLEKITFLDPEAKAEEDEAIATRKAEQRAKELEIEEQKAAEKLLQQEEAQAARKRALEKIKAKKEQAKQG
jgi:hypothetical protein